MNIDSYISKPVLEAKKYSMDHFTVAWERGDEIIRAMANECPYSPDESIQTAVIEAVSQANLYPEDPTGAYRLRGKIAEFCGVEKENVTFGNGSMELLDIAFRLFLEPGFNILTSLPEYPAYLVRSTLSGGGVITSPTNDDLSINVDGLLSKIDSTIRLIALSRPHNPSGTVVSRSDVVRLLETDIPVLVDEAYIELSDTSDSLVNLIREHNNLLVTRTFSKGFGLAGFRIGYLIADAKIIDYANRAKPSMNVNLLAQTAALAALNNLDRTLRHAEDVKQNREWVFNGLRKLPGLKPIPSEANFIMINCAESVFSSKEIVDALLEKDIFVRDFSHTAGLPPNTYFRITIGQKEDMERVLRELRVILKE